MYGLGLRLDPGQFMLASLSADYRSVLPRFYQLAIATTLSNLMVPLAGLCDTAFLGHLTDLRYLGGVILGSILFDYLYRILKFLRNSTNAITAQAAGQKDAKGVGLALLRSGLIALAIACLILLLQYPIRELGFAILSGSQAIETAGLDYFNGRIWGAPAVLLNFVLLGWLLGQEMTTAILLISLVGNGSNVLLDYWMINRWGWASAGAGWATALSQYLALVVGLVVVAMTVDRTAFKAALPEILDWSVLKGILIFKGNVLIRFVLLISTYAIFTNWSAALGTEILAANGLLLQVAMLSQFTVQGVGLTLQTLIASCEGRGQLALMNPLLLTAIAHALLIVLTIGGIAILFPQTVFGLLTNHGDLQGAIVRDRVWLLPLLGLTALAFMLEGYFLGRKQGVILRNGAFWGFGLGFLPLAIWARYTQSNVWLWLALSGYMATLTVFLTQRFFTQPIEFNNKVEQSKICES